MKIFDNVHDAYLNTLDTVLFRPQFTGVSPRGLETREIMNYTFSINKPKIEYIKTNCETRNKIIESYSKKEFDLYNSGTNKTEDFAKAAKFWNTIGNPDGTVNSAYGHLIWHKKSHGNLSMQFYDELKNGKQIRADQIGVLSENGMKTPWEWAKYCLKQDKHTRQAILRFSLPEHQWEGNKDQTCTMHGNFLIRNDQLHFTVVMRSNDLMKGLVYDLPWFVSLMHQMVKELKSIYPKLEVGTYTHTVHSMHIYKPDYIRILKMLGYKEFLATDVNMSTGNVSVKSLIYDKLVSGCVGFFIERDAEEIYVVQNRDIVKKTVDDKGAYKLVNYTSGIRL